MTWTTKRRTQRHRQWQRQIQENSENTLKERPQRFVICETFDSIEWTFRLVQISEKFSDSYGTFSCIFCISDDGLDPDISLRFPAVPHIRVYVPPTLHSCCVLFSRPDGWSFKSSLSSKWENPATQFGLPAEFVVSWIQLADFKRICSRKLSYFPSWNSQQIVAHCIAIITNALNINMKYFKQNHLIIHANCKSVILCMYKLLLFML